MKTKVRIYNETIWLSIDEMLLFSLDIHQPVFEQRMDGKLI